MTGMTAVRTLKAMLATNTTQATAIALLCHVHRIDVGDRDPRERDEQICQLIDCILEKDSVRRFLEEHKLEYEALAMCLRQVCHKRLREIPEGQAARNVLGTSEGTTLGSVLVQPGAEAMLARLVDEVRRRLPRLRCRCPSTMTTACRRWTTRRVASTARTTPSLDRADACGCAFPCREAATSA